MQFIKPLIMWYCTIFILTNLFSVTHTGKILGIFMVGTYSHNMMGFKLLKEMANRGHQVTFVNPYNLKEPVENFRNIQINVSLPYTRDQVIKIHLEREDENEEEQYFLYKEFISRHILQDPIFNTILSANETFDLMIYDQFASDIFSAVGYYFKCPVVVFIPLRSSFYNNHLVANPNSLHYLPTFSVRSINHNIYGRLKNVWCYLRFHFRNHLFLERLNEIAQEKFGPIPHIKELIYNASLVFTSSHISVSLPYPVVPMVKQIGGFHLEPPGKLPNDLKNYLDDANEGVILFTLGSFLRSALLSESKKRMVLGALGRVPEKVLWKFEEELRDLPENIKILSWLPQQDVLAHPNVKMFISHCGLLSVIEAVHHGKPLLCIPIYWDQFENSYLAALNGYGISLPFNELTEEKMYNGIQKITNDASYKMNAERRSKILNSDPRPALEIALFWLDYIIRHKGAPHLKSLAMQLQWYHFYYLDALALFLTILLLIICLLRLIHLQYLNLRKLK